MQSLTSALSVFQRFINCQTKRILIGHFVLLLRDWMSVSWEWFLRQLSRGVYVFTPVGWHSLIIMRPTEAYKWHWLSIKHSKSVKWDVLAWSINKINEFPLQKRDRPVSGLPGALYSILFYILRLRSRRLATVNSHHIGFYFLRFASILLHFRRKINS